MTVVLIQTYTLDTSLAPLAACMARATALFHQHPPISRGRNVKCSALPSCSRLEVVCNHSESRCTTRMAAIQFRKISVQSLSSDFRSATRIEPCEVDPDTLAEEDLLIRVEYVGINASDSNFSAGKYTPGVEPPFDCGFEAVGVVVGCGPTSADKAFLGRSVAVAGFGCFAEFLVVSRSSVLPIGEKPEPTSLAILVSGLTASISIAHTLGVGKRCREILSEGKTPSAIITAAAGGTGQFAV